MYVSSSIFPPTKHTITPFGCGSSSFFFFLPFDVIRYQNPSSSKDSVGWLVDVCMSAGAQFCSLRAGRGWGVWCPADGRLRWRHTHGITQKWAEEGGRGDPCLISPLQMRQKGNSQKEQAFPGESNWWLDSFQLMRQRFFLICNSNEQTALTADGGARLLPSSTSHKCCCPHGEGERAEMKRDALAFVIIPN